MSRRRRWITLLGVLLGLALLLGLGHRPALVALGQALVVEDPLAPADAIVVLGGGTPTREAAAAALYREGWAPRVILSHHETPARVEELIRLGVRPHGYQGEARLVLERYGVPRQAIVALEEPVKITETELRTVHRAVRAAGYRRVILVTSPHHTRRVRLIWGRETGGAVEGLLAPVRDDAFPPTGWWRDRRRAEAVLHEYLGILAIGLGLSHLMR